MDPASGPLGSLGPCLRRSTHGVRRSPLSREAELTTRCSSSASIVRASWRPAARRPTHPMQTRSCAASGRGADRADRGGPPAEAGLLQGAGRVLAGPRLLGRQITRPDGRSPTRPRIGRALGGPRPAGWQWAPESLSGRIVLPPGCSSGRRPLLHPPNAMSGTDRWRLGLGAFDGRT